MPRFSLTRSKREVYASGRQKSVPKKAHMLRLHQPEAKNPPTSYGEYSNSQWSSSFNGSEVHVDVEVNDGPAEEVVGVSEGPAGEDVRMSEGTIITFTILRAAVVFPLLGFTPNPEPVSSVAFPSLISVICRWSFAFRCWRRTPLLALFQVREGETRARTGNLAQTSRIRLGEPDEGSPKPHCVKGRPGDPFELLSEGMDSKYDAYEELISGRANSLGSPGETSEVALQWSGRNSMAPLRDEQLRVEQGYPPQVQASAESD
ncbi:hypothetical protein DEO72_LG7g1573 [Vigna unguiculata]|uniref:Uncharacterized protein n=1 Tax=Vigna unguiculata TaxID=3917 RepID=A0A4D6MFT1_VIGUN|nr:hypothetical protein DEO72_LG7g1573 [Vigna unguiculata]